VEAHLYNVAEALPERFWQAYDAFYTNPPYGSGNGGSSVQAFLQRAFELCGPDALGCVVIADNPHYPWCEDVLGNTQRFLLDNGFTIFEMRRAAHCYHLADAPDLTSCNIVVKSCGRTSKPYQSRALDGVSLLDFYGRESPLRIRYIRDLREGGKFPSRDYKAEPLNSEHRK
jgi:predicted RNA methylase